MDNKIVKGYCKTQKTNYSVEIKILESSTSEGTEQNYGTFSCKFKSCGNICPLKECSVLSSNRIKVGDSL